MNRLNKKAVSAVVATVLIIMITVAAVGIIWAAIIPMVRDSLNKGTICNDALSDISLISDKGYTCIDRDSGNVSLQIRKGSNAKVDLVAVDALIFVGGDSFAYTIEKTNDGTKNISGVLPTSNLEKTVYIWQDTLKNATKVKIAPVVTIGNTEETCEATSEVFLSECSN